MYYPPNNNAAFLLKTDSVGISTGVIPLNAIENAKTSKRNKVYPNPAHDYTIIELPENLKNPAELKVYNSHGQLLFQKILNKGKKAIKLALQGFDKGIYFFEIIGEGGVLGGGRFVKQ